jgi:hypothetical protein
VDSPRAATAKRPVRGDGDDPNQHICEMQIPGFLNAPGNIGADLPPVSDVDGNCRRPPSPDAPRYRPVSRRCVDRPRAVPLLRPGVLRCPYQDARVACHVPPWIVWTVRSASFADSSLAKSMREIRSCSRRSGSTAAPGRVRTEGPVRSLGGKAGCRTTPRDAPDRQPGMDRNPGGSAPGAETRSQRRRHGLRVRRCRQRANGSAGKAGSERIRASASRPLSPPRRVRSRVIVQVGGIGGRANAPRPPPAVRPGARPSRGARARRRGREAGSSRRRRASGR